jgi:hypothetical protein
MTDAKGPLLYQFAGHSGKHPLAAAVGDEGEQALVVGSAAVS